MATGGLAILVDEKRVNDLLQQKSGLKALLRSTFNTVLFAAWISGNAAAIAAILLSCCYIGMHTCYIMLHRHTYGHHRL